MRVNAWPDLKACVLRSVQGVYTYVCLHDHPSDLFKSRVQHSVCVKISICDYKDYESTAVETSSGWFSRGYAALTYLLTQYSFLCVRLVVIVIVISFPP